MITLFNSSIELFNSAKATKTRSGCWITVVAGFCVTVFKALFFAFANIYAKRAYTGVTSRAFVEREGAYRCRSVYENRSAWTIAVRYTAATVNRTEVNNARGGIDGGVAGLSISRSNRSTIFKTWCCNLAARVLRCQRRRRGFDSPQHRHGIGRSVAGPWFVRPMTRVRFPSHPPLYLGVAQQ